MWDQTPYFVGGNAKHSEEVMRTLAFVATGGAEGVARPGDLRVVPATPPGAQVVVSAGGVIILNRGANSYEQSYVARNPDGDPLAVAATGSTGGRSDLIVVRVEDLNAVGGTQWAGNGADKDAGPFVFSRVIPNVPPGTTSLQAVTGHANDPGVAIARVDLPANTATVTAGMITDLRALANPRTRTRNYIGKPTDATVTLSTTAWRAFPATAISGIDVPPWATHATVLAQTTFQYVDGNAVCNFQAFMGPAGQMDDVTLFSDQQIDSTTVGGGYRQPLVMPNDRVFAIPSAWRGTSVQIAGRVRGTSNGGRIASRAADYWTAAVTFDERAA